MKKFLKKLCGAALLIFMGILAGIVIVSNLPSTPTPTGRPTPRPTGDDWIDLLAPERHTGWKNISGDEKIFEIQDGVLHIFGGLHLGLRNVAYTAQPFDDFDLHIEFKVKPTPLPRWLARSLMRGLQTNSGVFLRVQPEDVINRGFEIQVLDDYGMPPHKQGSGAIYDVVSPMFNMARPGGEWNSYDVQARGTHIRVWMNGWLVVDTDFAQMTEPIGKFKYPYAQLPRSGFIALQDHGGEIWYRNILVRPVSAAAPPAGT
jgi:hypothetical protein